MKKLRIDDLEVETFVTSDELHGVGTVQAHVFEQPLEDVVDPAASAAYETCKQTCPYTCVFTQDVRQCPPLMA